MPTGNDCTLGNTRILGVIDPPRAGVSDKVMHGCRKVSQHFIPLDFNLLALPFSQMLQLKTLVYVSCNPKSVMKNLVDLCRPISRKFDAEPFRIVSIQPVDMFPLTEHFEWIIKLER
jgi:tRNA/tmRNA/rRNA uracil-C5-methylase (TrmA/RlmC/RlmD family)